MTTAYTRTATDIIKKALTLCRAYDPSEEIDLNDYQTCIDSLNSLIKTWQSQGYNLWLLRDAVLFLNTSQRIYTLGNDGDHCCEETDFINTTASVAAATGDDDITLTSVTGLSGADDIYAVEQTSIITAWAATNASKSVSSDTLTITNTAASAGYVIFTIEDLTAGNEYRITYGYDSTGTGSGAVFSVISNSVTLDSATQTVTGTYTMDFTADQTEATFKIVQSSTTISQTEKITAFNMIDVDSGDRIGIELDDATRQWTRIVSIASNVVTLKDVLTDDVTIGNTVYSYTTKIDKPMRIMDTRYLSTPDDSEINIELVARKDYMMLTDKTSTGTVLNAYYLPQVSSGDLYVWNTPSGVIPLVKFGYVKPIDILASTADSVIFPSEWFMPISYSLAAAIAPEYKTDVSRMAYLEQKSMALLESVLTFDNEDGSLFLGIDYE